MSFLAYLMFTVREAIRKHLRLWLSWCLHHVKMSILV